MTKKQDQIREKPQYLKFCFWCSALGPASSHFHLAQIITVTLNPPPLKMLFVYSFNALKPSTEIPILYSASLNINQICPQNGPQKTITLHNAQNKTWCFRNGPLWKMKTLMLTKTRKWKNKKNTNKKKGFERQRQTGNTPPKKQK